MNVECSCLLKVMSLFIYFSTEVPPMFNINIGSIPFNKSFLGWGMAVSCVTCKLGYQIRENWEAVCAYDVFFHDTVLY